MTTEAKVVIGSNYGDEGKGHMTDYLADKAKEKEKSVIVVCSNGGAQRGHTVELNDGRRHVFHHFGSGTFSEAETYLPKQFILNPMVFNREYNELITKMVEPICTVHPECLVSTPYDMIMNQIIEESRGDKKHGSCGLGIWETIVRHKEYDTSLETLMRLNEEDKLKEWLVTIRDNYLEERLISEGAKNLPDPKFESKIYQKWNPIIYSENLIDNWIMDFQNMISRIKKIQFENYISSFDTIIFENGQGLLLDEKEGIHSTPSKTGLNNPLEILQSGLGEECKNINLEIIYVSRPYLTRHGADPSFVENLTIMKGCHDKTNVYNPHQGTLRYGEFSPKDSLYSRIYIDSCDFCTDRKIDGLINHRDVLSWNIFVALTHCDQRRRKTFKEYPDGIPNTINAKDFEVVYESYGPTRKDISDYSYFHSFRRD